jgi:hypothetical protein
LKDLSIYNLDKIRGKDLRWDVGRRKMWGREGYVNSSSNTQYRYRCMIIKNVNRTRERRERERGGQPKRNRDANKMEKNFSFLISIEFRICRTSLEETIFISKEIILNL